MKKNKKTVEAKNSDEGKIAAQSAATKPARGGRKAVASAEVVPPVSGDSTYTKRKEVPQRLAQKLLKLRLRHGLTQTEMLLIINSSESEENRARISQYERGTRTPSLIEMLNYASYAGLSIEVLVNDNLELPREYRRY